MQMIDWAGLGISLVAIVLLLVCRKPCRDAGADIAFQIPLSEGGSQFSWNSSLVISMLVIGGIVVFAFLAVEWKVASLPIMPRKLPSNLQYISSIDRTESFSTSLQIRPLLQYPLSPKPNLRLCLLE